MAEETQSTDKRPFLVGQILKVIGSVVFSAGVIGFVVAVAAPFAEDWIRMGVDEQGIDGFWGPIIRLVVVILLLVILFAALILIAISLLMRSWRERLWVRSVNWVRGLRVTTASRRESLRKDHERHGLKLANEKLHPAYEAALARASAAENEIQTLVADGAIKDARIQSLQDKVSEFEAADKKRKNDDLIQKLLTKPPPPPLPRPRWLAGPDNTDDLDRYAIQNTVPRSVAREVRVEADEDMDIVDAGHWQDLSTNGPEGGVGIFRAYVSERGRMNYVTVTISWYDEKGKRDSVRKNVFPRPKPHVIESLEPPF